MAFLSKNKCIWVKGFGKIYPAELKTFCLLTCKSLNYCKYFLYENGNARIYWWKEGTYSSPTYITGSYNYYFLSKESFSGHLTVLQSFAFWLCYTKREKYARFQKMKKDISNIFIIHLHEFFIYLVILVIIPRFFVSVVQGNRWTICLCILFS